VIGGESTLTVTRTFRELYPEYLDRCNEQEWLMHASQSV
jgi:hypothetical protein